MVSPLADLLDLLVLYTIKYVQRIGFMVNVLTKKKKKNTRTFLEVMGMLST